MVSLNPTQMKIWIWQIEYGLRHTQKTDMQAVVKLTDAIVLSFWATTSRRLVNCSLVSASRSAFCFCSLSTAAAYIYATSSHIQPLHCSSLHICHQFTYTVSPLQQPTYMPPVHIYSLSTEAAYICRQFTYTLCPNS